MLYRAIAIILLLSFCFMSCSCSYASGVYQTYTREGESTFASAFAHLFGNDKFTRSHAVVIGIGDYDHYSGLVAPANDAARVRDFLRDEAGFDTIVTLTDEEATMKRIVYLMEEQMPTLVGKNDRFIFYFSGHGVTRTLNSRERGYLVLKNARQDQWERMIDMPRILQWMENVEHARHVLFIIDSCFSGLAAVQTMGGKVGEKTIKRLMQPAHQIITAGVNMEESYSYNGASLFTSAFLSAARGKIDPPANGVISVDEIMIRINREIDAKRAELGDNIKMTPHKYMQHIQDNAGEFFFLYQSCRLGVLREQQWIQPELGVLMLS
jgi:hypothetical protein